ncbi:hypothetical protein CRE_21989 [Caenorhabditis remanei]|uniref:F-box domain-containing protein n=1 Tax=Caenorhabditis remanei TaxID=31234 RepID=E3N3H3_CAERE|nr:hypothetical protein CRE_21989 [Caenorhabditis remanei]
MSSPFPLLRLPGVVLCEIFKSLSIGEKIMLSFCSKKVSIQINIARLYSQKVIVDLDLLYQRIIVYSENDQDFFKVSIYPDSGKTFNSNTQQFSIACRTTGITTFWKNDQKGFLFITHHLWKMFPCKMSIDSSFYSSDLFQPTISMLFDLQVEFEELNIVLQVLKDHNLFWDQTSSKFGLVEYLRISSIPNPGFKPVFISWPQKIDIWKSYWFTLEHLLECTCTRIILRKSHQNEDLNVIIENWKAGGFPNLEYLYVESHYIRNNGTTILGMYLLELDGKVIQTDDESSRATFELGYQSNEMSVTPLQLPLHYILK